MKKQLNSILLIDDDEATNFINEMVIKEADCTNKIITVETGTEALEFLLSKTDGKHPQPDLIFLDINMPQMNGWEFLEEYKKLKEHQKGKITIVMLTTSLNPDDEKRAEKIKDIDDFKNKPLTLDTFIEILKKHFPENF